MLALLVFKDWFIPAPATKNHLIPAATNATKDPLISTATVYAARDWLIPAAKPATSTAKGKIISAVASKDQSISTATACVARERSILAANHTTRN